MSTHSARLGSFLIASALLAAACGGSGGDTAEPPATTAAPSTTGAPASSAPPDTTIARTTTTEAEPGIPIVPQIAITGEEEVVWDWTTDRCEDEHIPDIAARAFRDADDQVQLSIGHYVTYRMIGPSLDEVATDCTAAVLDSDYDPDPAQFNDSEWIGAPYTLDGETVYAVVHNEYRGWTHGAARPGQCPSGDTLPCLDTSLTMLVSTDGGASFDDIAEPPGHLIATLPDVYADDTIPTGLRQPSNIVQDDEGYFYNFSNVSAPPDERQWTCLMRTDDLSDPTSWRYWNGTDFTGRFVDPYRETTVADPDTCAPLQGDAGNVTVNETVVWDEVLERWVMMGLSFHPVGPDPQWGLYYTTSEDLVHWSTRQLLTELEMGNTVADDSTDLYYAYPSVIDPDSSSRNFETTDGEAYLYISRFNAGGGSLDRDLLRFPISSTLAEVPPPVWDFGTDGDTEGWSAENGLDGFDVAGGSLVMRSTAEDPYFGVGNLGFPAAYDQITVSMSASGEGTQITGELFFVTSASPTRSERQRLAFLINADGERRDYVLDLSTVSSWEGEIIGLRLDPGPDAGRDISIDRIAVSAG